MKVLFLSHVINVWKAWDIKDVKTWYARNFLIPNWLAKELTPELEKSYREKERKQEEHRRDLLENRHSIVDKLGWQKLEFFLESSASWKVYGWIWETDIINEIKKKFKVDLSKKHINFNDWHIKKLWEENVFINLWKDSIAKITVVVNKK